MYKNKSLTMNITQVHDILYVVRLIWTVISLVFFYFFFSYLFVLLFVIILSNVYCYIQCCAAVSIKTYLSPNSRPVNVMVPTSGCSSSGHSRSETTQRQIIADCFCHKQMMFHFGARDKFFPFISVASRLLIKICFAKFNLRQTKSHLEYGMLIGIWEPC